MNDIQSPPATPPTTEKEEFESKLAESVPKALLAGIIAGVVGSTIWAAIAYFTHYKIGWIAIGIGLAVGVCVKIFGKGEDVKFQIIGGTLALLSCIIGDYFTIIAFASKEFNAGFFETLGAIPISEIPSVIKETFSFMDAVFYAIATWCGWKSAGKA